MKQTSQAQYVNDFRWRHYDVIDSTSDEAKRIVESGEIKKTLITATSQTKGHGRYGREWISPPGNLYTSLLLPVNVGIEYMAELSFVAAVAVGEVLQNFLSDTSELCYKWPNDVLVDDKKIAGILLESSAKAGEKQGRWVIIGLGINILQAPLIPEKPCIALNQLIPMKNENVQDTILDINKSLVASFVPLHDLWEAEGFDAIKTKWLEKMWRYKRSLSVESGKQMLQGVCEGISQKGELMLKDDNGIMHTITAGEVFFGNNEVSVSYAPRH